MNVSWIVISNMLKYPYDVIDFKGIKFFLLVGV